MSGIHSFSHRQNEKKLGLRPVDKHKFPYSLSTLSHMLNNYPVFVEMGGLLGLAYALRTDTLGGIRDDEKGNEYAKRKSLYMTNEYPLPPVRHFAIHLLEGLNDAMIKILIFAGIISMVAGIVKDPGHGWVEGFTILVCVAVVVFIGAYNNYKQEVASRELAASLKGSDVSAIRNGKQISLPQEQILVGDLICLNPSNMIPADGVMADQTTIRVNESALTGESFEKVKCVMQPTEESKKGKFPDPFLSAGTEVTDGSCVMLVTAVGDNSAKGKIMKSLTAPQGLTNLQIRLEHVARLAAYIGLVCGVGAFIALLTYFFIDNKHADMASNWYDLVDIFVISITVVIVAVPEGLPLAVTISMAYSMKKMRADQNLVKVLAACETMGNATTICSDKTGTLTQNKMTVVQTYVGGNYFLRQPQAPEVHLTLHKLLVDAIVLNSNRRFSNDTPDLTIPPEDWKWEGDGGATESALLSWIARYHNITAAAIAPSIPGNENSLEHALDYKHHLTFGRDIMQLRKDNRDRIIQVYSFSSAKKYSSVIIAEGVGSLSKQPSSDKKITDISHILPKFGRHYYKGAADRIIKRCTKMIAADGTIVDVGDLANIPELPKSGTMEGMCQHVSHSSDGNHEYCNKWALLALKGNTQPIVCGSPEHFPPGTTAADFEIVEQHPLKVMMNMTRLGLRCIAFAYVENVPLAMRDGQFVNPEEDPNEPWHLIGIVGIQDPLRVETSGAVMAVQQAGIIVRMVTGDNLDTATFIAKDCGIISHRRHIAVEGSDFRQALEDNLRYRKANRDKDDPTDEGPDDPKFVDFITNLRVVARCQPDDKYELVKYLREQGEVVGVTGDGSNDGPALKAANVGLSMGIAGTDIAKAAADIIILDDNFSSIVRSVMWGRSIFDNIRKFVQFQLSVNFCALVIAFVGAIDGGREPLKPIQLLYVNLAMDSLAALAIGTEVPKPDLLRRKAYTPEAPLISSYMWRNIFCQTFFQLAILLPMLFTGKDWFPRDLHHWISKLVDPNDSSQGSTYTYEYWEDRHYTLIFNTFVWMQLFNELVCRKCNGELTFFSGIFDNAWFVSICVGTYIFQVLIIEFFGSFMMTEPQSWQLWLVALGLGSTQLITGFLLNLLTNRFIDSEEGQIKRDEKTFENARWVLHPEILDSVINEYKSSAEKGTDQEALVESTDDKVTRVYKGLSFKQSTNSICINNAKLASTSVSADPKKQKTTNEPTEPEHDSPQEQLEMEETNVINDESDNSNADVMTPLDPKSSLSP